MATLNDGRISANVTANKTLALADCGIVQNVTATGKTITLPASAAGLNYHIRIGGAANSGFPAGSGSDGTVAVVIAPNGTDTVGGNGFTPGAGKGPEMVLASSKVGDEIKLIGGASGTWVIEYSRGAWTRTA